MPKKEKDGQTTLSSRERRAVLRRLGRFAAVSGPAVTLLLAAETKPAAAVGSTESCIPVP
ncbi:MAG TPA: hypothetical protein VFA91_02460 [Candidatus Polarisedimenticolia bacterium]|nr:hypothetical protein [Candidatus Polarisedimenticolia bacterium]